MKSGQEAAVVVVATIGNYLIIYEHLMQQRNNTQRTQTQWKERKKERRHTNFLTFVAHRTTFYHLPFVCLLNDKKVNAF